MKLCRKRKITILSLFACLFMQTHVFAQQQYTYAASPLVSDSVKAGKILAVKDTVFYDPSLKPYIAKTFSRNAIISLSINESVNKQMPDTFSASVFVTEQATDESGATITKNDTLTISYSKNNPYNGKAVRMFKGTGGPAGYPAAQVQINEVRVSGATPDNVIPFLRMDNMIVVNRTFTTDCSAITSVSTDTTSVSRMGELSVSWTGMRFMPVYDLEWTYIDKSALDAGNYNTNGQLDASRIFKNNASRITTSLTGYRIPLLYDNTGSLFWRVRGVQYATSGELINSTWSSDAGATGLGRYDFTGHERKLNWQATTSFAEEGKRKSVVQYFDGSLKGRQTVTKDNTTATTIVAETFYDKQGRPAIQVLPAPTLDNLIRYTPRFNQLNTSEYDKNQYDSLLNVNDYCSVGASGMDTISGASQYYSPANPLLQTGNAAYHRFVPDAKKYPFTETRYTRDNTGRIDRQGGVGGDMQIGSGHETKYYYGTPTQEDLDALFGTEAGDFSHYQKNMVRDANGQYSVSYVDMSGHTVATALTGSSPVTLQQLGNYSFFRQTDSLLTPVNNIIKEGTMQMSGSLLVPQAADYIFHYNLVPESLGLADCRDSNICYDCLYDLTITITDQCGNPPTVITKSNFKLFKDDDSTYNLDTTCTAPLPIDLMDTVHLNEGNYDITKTLNISRAGMAYYRDSLFMKHNTCRTYTSFALSQMDSLRLFLDCSMDSATSYLTDSYRSQMLADLRPLTGQYGDTALNGTCFSIFDISLDGIFQLPRMVYQTVSGYKDEAGNPDYVRNSDGVLVAPQYLSRADFIANFKDSWLEALLPKHPEYNIYQQHNSLVDAEVWESDFLNTDTYDSALAKGYLNPTGSNAAPASKFTINRKDPLVTYFFTTNAKSDLEDFLFNYTQRMGLSTNHNLWQTATAMVKCAGGSDSCMTQWATNATAFDSSLCKADVNQAWRIFRNAYLTKRADWIDTYTKAAANMRGGYMPPPGCTASLVFPSPSNLLTANKSSSDLYGGYNGTAGDTTTARNNLRAFLYNNCKAYASRWWQQLAPCGYTIADSAAIVDKLIQVCYEGADADHPLGSSTVKPSSTNTFRSFEQVIAWYNNTYYAGQKPPACSAYLIDKPTSYDQPSLIVNKPLLTAPDACTCSRINDLYNGYQANPAPYGSFSGYMQLVYHTTIAQSTLDSLRNLCSGTLNCRYLESPITIPPALQCGSGDVCASCYTVSSWNDSFMAKYPAIVPRQQEADSTQHLANQMYANYMNLHLGFSKSSFDYLAFLDSCPLAAKQPPQAETTGGICDSLNNIISQFDCYYKSLDDSVANEGTCGQTYWQAGSQAGFASGAAGYYSTYLPEIIRNSALVIPAPAADKYNGGFSYSLARPICISNEVTIEWKIKNTLLNDCPTCPGDAAMGFSNHSINDNPALQDEDFYFDMLRIASGGFYSYRHGSQIGNAALNNRNLDDWHTVKLQVTTAAFTVYFDNNSILSVPRDGHSFIDKLTQIYLPLWGYSGRALDWVKISVPSGGTDQVVYFEDFTAPAAMSRPDPLHLCPKPPARMPSPACLTAPMVLLTPIMT